RPAHQYRRHAQTRPPPLRSWRARRNRNRRPDTRPSLRRRQIPPLTERQVIRRGTACRARTTNPYSLSTSPNVAVRALIAFGQDNQTVIPSGAARVFFFTT